jgi:hypothetical protein
MLELELKEFMCDPGIEKELSEDKDLAWVEQDKWSSFLC